MLNKFNDDFSSNSEFFRNLSITKHALFNSIMLSRSIMLTFFMYDSNPLMKNAISKLTVFIYKKNVIYKSTKNDSFLFNFTFSIICFQYFHLLLIIRIALCYTFLFYTLTNSTSIRFYFLILTGKQNAKNSPPFHLNERILQIHNATHIGMFLKSNFQIQFYCRCLRIHMRFYL